MNSIYITGHKNPDIDCICSAYAYAQLKNEIEGGNRYVPVRCGHISDSVKRQLDCIGFKPQPYMKDVHPKVCDVMLKPDVVMDASSPVFDLIRIYDERQPSVIPITENGRFLGLLSLDDITAWFLKDNSNDYPEYELPVDNIASVIPGKIIQRGEKDVIHASLIAGAAAFDEFERFVNPGKQCVLVIGFRQEHIEHAARMQVPAIIITTSGSASNVDFSGYKGLVYETSLGSAETLRRLRMVPTVRSIMGRQGPVVQMTDLFDDAKEMLTESSFRGLAVFDGDIWAGYVTRRCFLDKPRYNVIMVDHNEVSQSICGVEEANVLEIIDHHRIDAPKTDTPIMIDAEPLGSTCTIVYQQYLRNNIIPDETTSKILLTGIICDTLILKSPTTTAIDVLSANQLAENCRISDIQAFGLRLFNQSEVLGSRNPQTVINSDFKTYTQSGVKVGIGQCEVSTLEDIDEYKDRYLSSLEEICKSNGLNWAMLMVTDVLKGDSILLSSQSRYEKKLSYSSMASHIYVMQGVLSRKKQLLPEIIHALNS